jgi:three-Cys-motif partner protein
MEESLNNFGGFWTKQKISIFLKYLKAYLDIMNKHHFKIIYFDGFAGCGTIDSDENSGQLIDSVAIEVLSIQHTKIFDIYYLVDLSENKVKELKKIVKERFPLKTGINVVHSDCNKKLIGMAEYLKKNKNHRALAFIDPFGMAVNWSSLEACKGYGIDMWILVPTGIGVNRLLTKSGNISDNWLKKLEMFLGIERSEIKNYFYKEQNVHTLFGIETTINKEQDAIKKIADLYCERLKGVWKYVSNPMPLKNNTGSIMYHFVLATNNASGLKIANDIIGKMS